MERVAEGASETAPSEPPSSTRARGRTTLLVLLLAAVLSLGGVAAAAFVLASDGAGGAPGHDPLPTLTDVTPPLAAASPTAGSSGAAAAPVAAALAEPLTDPALGSVGGVVVDVATGAVLYDRQGSVPRAPASTTKVLTAATAMRVLGADARLRTVVVAGHSPGEVVLVGGGDVTLARTTPSDLYPGAATVAALAEAVRPRLPGGPPVRVVVDTSRYSGPGVAPGVTVATTRTNLPTVGPVMIDGGRVVPDEAYRETDPDLVVGRALATALGNPAAEVVRGTAPHHAAELGAVASPPVRELVRVMLLLSDNVLAEALGREAALRTGLPGSFEGASAAVTRTVTGLVAATPGGAAAAAGTALVDTSGLSPDDRVAPATVAAVLLAAARGPEADLRQVLDSLPVAGYAGTLAERFRRDPAAVAGAGDVRAKTGRLSHVSALAGLVGTADGRLLAFAFADDAVTHGPVRASAALDRAVAALARCTCGPPAPQ